MACANIMNVEITKTQFLPLISLQASGDKHVVEVYVQALWGSEERPPQGGTCELTLEGCARREPAVLRRRCGSPVGDQRWS